MNRDRLMGLRPWLYSVEADGKEIMLLGVD